MIGIKSEAVLLFRKFITSKPLKPNRIRNPRSGRALSSSADRETIEAPEPSPGGDLKRITKLSKDMKEIRKYFENVDCDGELDRMPPRIIRQRKSKPEHLYLLDYKTADAITDLIRDDLVANPHNIIEANPGTGVLTERLLAAGVPSLTLMEPSVKLIRVLAALQTIYSNRMTIREADLLNVWKLAYQDKQDGGGRLAALFSEFPHAKWGEDVGLQIIAPVTNGNFIRQLILDIVRQCGLVSYGRPCLYLFITPMIWSQMTCSNNANLNEYRGSSVLFQLMFDYRKLGEIPRKAFLPWTPSYTAKKTARPSRRSKMNNDDMYVVRIEGKKNLLTEIIDEKRMQPLWYFINHHMVARTGKIIPQLEVWEPGCGPKLIRQGFNIFTQFGDLGPYELLKLFKEFSTWEGYQNSFLPAMENASHKMEQLLF